MESDLKEKGLPTSFAESLIHLEDNEKISEVVNEIKADFDKAVQEQVKEATRQTTPTGQQSNLGSQNKRVQVSQILREKTESLNKRRYFKHGKCNTTNIQSR